MDVRTHPMISSRLVGKPIEVENDRASARLETYPEMAADERGLVHGGFTFGLADYAAMLAVNDPKVVLGGSECRFLAPVTVGETMTATAEITEVKGKKRVVHCSVATHRKVFEGTFVCFVLDQHVLDQAAS